MLSLKCEKMGEKEEHILLIGHFHDLLFDFNNA